jgi:hypothetical protein
MRPWRKRFLPLCGHSGSGYAIRLPNGNTLVAAGKGAYEINKNKKVVWKKTTDTPLWRVQRR